jgi:nitrogen fixation/metabolism regulation signal transduction histidine kinase
MEYRKQFKRVFEPGFTTKKRGWGLSLLKKRIVEEYHRGSKKVSHSEIGKAPL